MKKLSVIRAEFLMRVASFATQEHESVFKRWVANGVRWLGRHRQRSGSLDFLEGESSIDLLDYEELDDLADRKEAKP